MTFGQSAAGRSMSRAGLFFKKQLWIWPIIAVVLLAAIGYGLRLAIERTMKASLKSELQTLLNVERSMLETWLKVQEANAESLAHDQQVRVAATELLAASQPSLAEDSSAAATKPEPGARRVSAALHARLVQELGPGMTSHQFVSYLLADKQRQIISSTNPDQVGQTIPQYDTFLTRTLEGQTTVSAPFGSVVSMKDEFGRTRTGVPTMFVCVMRRRSVDE